MNDQTDRREDVSPTPEQIIAGYIFGSVRLGAKFGDQPYPGYTEATVKAVLRDLVEHGYSVTEVDRG